MIWSLTSLCRKQNKILKKLHFITLPDKNARFIIGNAETSFSIKEERDEIKYKICNYKKGGSLEWKVKNYSIALEMMIINALDYLNDNLNYLDDRISFEIENNYNIYDRELYFLGKLLKEDIKFIVGNKEFSFFIYKKSNTRQKYKLVFYNLEQNIFTTAKKYEYEKYSEALEVMLWMTLEYLNKKNIKNQNKINIQVNEAKPKTKKNNSNIVIWFFVIFFFVVTLITVLAVS